MANGGWKGNLLMAVLLRTVKDKLRWYAGEKK